MDHRGLRTLLVIHGFITLAAGIVLAIAPDLIAGMSLVAAIHAPRSPRRSRCSASVLPASVSRGGAGPLGDIYAAFVRHRPTPPSVVIRTR